MEPTISTAQMAGMLFPLLFNMMGPIGVIPVFAAVTGALDQPTRAAIASRAALLSLAALAVAVFIGAAVLEGWGIGRGSLIMAAGLIVTLSALQPMLMAQKPGAGEQAAPTKPMALATAPIAFPGIVSPKAVAVLIIFVAYFPAMQEKFAVFAVACLVLLLDWLGMRGAQWFMAKVGMVPLMVLGAVFGVLQVALGVEMLVNGWHALAMP